MSIHPDAVPHEVRSPGGTVRVHDTGEPGDPRPTVVLLHGTGGDTASHFRTVYPLLAVRHRTVGIDFAPAGDGLSLDALVEQTLSVLRDRVPDRTAHLVGYSLGAVVAAAASGTAPEQVRTLTLVAGWLVTDAHQRLRNDLWQRLHATDPEALRLFSTFTAFGDPFLGRRTDQEVAALVRAHGTAPDVAAQMRLNRDVDISGPAARITAPTLLVAGTHDQMVPARHSRMLLGAIDDARLAELPCGHAIPAERPAQLVALLEDFLAEPARLPAGGVLDPIAV